MKNTSILAILSIILFVAGCSQGSGSSNLSLGGSDNSQIVATISGEPIRAGELDASVKQQMQRIETQVYQIRKRGLDTLIDDKLIEMAAKKNGKTVDEFMAEEIDAKIEEPSEKEIKALYEARKGKNTLPFEKIKGQIIEYLKQTKKNQVRRNLLAKLTKDAEIKILLEPPRTEIDIGNSPVMGPKNAKITLIEFSDYQCPFCKRVRPTVWKLMEDYKGKIQYSFKDFPLSFHQHARKAHEAALCAGDQDKYFEYNKTLFDNQSNMSIADLKKYAAKVGLNTSKFNKCLDEGKYSEAVDKSIQEGIEVGVTGTPAFFINGIQLSGAQPIASFQEIIDEELKK